MNPEKMPSEVDQEALGEELSEEVKAARAAVIHDMEHPDEEPAPVQSSKETLMPDISSGPGSDLEEAKRMVAKEMESGMAAKGIEEEK